MKTILSLIALIAISVIVGCNPPAESGDSNTTTAEVSTSSTLLCGKCGAAKGSEICCADDAETCACGMHKGTALCCKEIDLAGKDLCTACGSPVEGVHTCSADAEKSEACGLEKGSAACCKLGEAG